MIKYSIGDQVTLYERIYDEDDNDLFTSNNTRSGIIIGFRDDRAMVACSYVGPVLAYFSEDEAEEGGDYFITKNTDPESYRERDETIEDQILNYRTNCRNFNRL